MAVSEAGGHLKELVRTLPTGKPVRWRWHTFPNADDTMGDCGLVKGHYVIRLKRGISGYLLEVVIAHEYAHALCWEYTERVTPKHYHPPEFWLAFGRAYDAILGHQE